MSQRQNIVDSARANVLGNEINKYVRLAHPEYAQIDYVGGIAFALAMAVAEGGFVGKDVAAMVTRLLDCQAVKLDVKAPLDENQTRTELARRGVDPSVVVPVKEPANGH